uniref:Uncharacterized protein n=1 Tax=Oryza punctata TaxID=4537 RepID=A0A0E0LA13_ORYPU
MELQKKKTKKRKDEEDIKSNVRSEEEVQKSEPKQEGTKEKHKMKENAAAGTISNAKSNENSNSMTQGTDIHQLEDIRGSLKESEKDKTETNHIQERSSTITQNSGNQIPQSPTLLHDELNMLNSQATPVAQLSYTSLMHQVINSPRINIQPNMNSMILTTSRFSPQNTELNDRNSAIFMPSKQDIYQEFDEMYNNNNCITSEIPGDKSMEELYKLQNTHLKSQRIPISWTTQDKDQQDYESDQERVVLKNLSKHNSREDEPSNKQDQKKIEEKKVLSNKESDATSKSIQKE